MKTRELIVIAHLRADSALRSLHIRKVALAGSHGCLAQSAFLMAAHHVAIARRAVTTAEKQLKKEGGRS